MDAIFPSSFEYLAHFLIQKNEQLLKMQPSIILRNIQKRLRPLYSLLNLNFGALPGRPPANRLKTIDQLFEIWTLISASCPLTPRLKIKGRSFTMVPERFWKMYSRHPSHLDERRGGWEGGREGKTMLVVVLTLLTFVALFFTMAVTYLHCDSHWIGHF